MADMGIRVNVSADLMKIQQLNRDLDQTKQKLINIQKANQGSGPMAGALVPGSSAMPMAGTLIRPPSSSHSGGSSAVMWGPAYRAAMHTAMPGHFAHKYGAGAPLTGPQTSPLHASSMSGAASGSSLTRLTTSIDRLTQSLNKPAKPAAGLPSYSNPFVTLQSQGTVLQALSDVSGGVTRTPYGRAKLSAVPTASVSFSNPNIAQMAAAHEALTLSTIAPTTASVIAGRGRMVGYTGSLSMAGMRAAVINPPRVSDRLPTPYPYASGRQSGSTLLHHVRRYAMARMGIPYELASAMEGAGAGVAGEAGASGIAGMLGGAASLGPIAGIALAAMAVTAGVQKVASGFQTYQQSAPGASDLYHTILPGKSYRSFYSGLVQPGYGIGASNAQMVQAAQILAATGGPGALSSLGSVASGALGLGYGLNGVSTLAQSLSELQRLGITSGISATATNRSAIFALGNATVAGGMQGRTSSLITGVTDLVQTLDQQRTTAPNFAKLLGMMTTLSGSGLQALQGSRGATLLSTFNNSLTNPGGGSAGQLFMYNALTNGTNLSPFGEMYLAQQGLTGSYGGKTNLQRVMQYSLKMFPDLSHMPTVGMKGLSNQQLMGLTYMSNVMGMSMPQAQAFMSTFDKNGHFSMANMNAESNWWGSIGGLPKSASMSILAAQLYQSRGSASGLAKVMGTMGANGFTFSAQQEHLLAQAHGGNQSAAKQLSLSLGHEMQNGQLLTSQDRLIQAINQNNNVWTKLGRELVPLVTDVNHLVTAIGQTANNVSNGFVHPNKSLTPGAIVKNPVKAFSAIPGAVLKGAGTNPSNPFLGAIQNWISSNILNQSYTNPATSTTAMVANMMFQGGVQGVGTSPLSFSPGGSTPILSSASPASVSTWSRYIKQASAKYGVPANLLASLITQESSGNPNAVSSAGAIGLTQLMPGTAAGLGVNPHNPLQNIMGGANYLHDQYKRFGSWNAALQAYNGGPGGVGGAAEQKYAREVIQRWEAYQQNSPLHVHVHIDGKVHSKKVQMSGLKMQYA